MGFTPKQIFWISRNEFALAKRLVHRLYYLEDADSAKAIHFLFMKNANTANRKPGQCGEPENVGDYPLSWGDRTELPFFLPHFLRLASNRHAFACSGLILKAISRWRTAPEVSPRSPRETARL